MIENTLAKELGWRVGVDYPEWGNNSLYLQTIKGSYLQDGETPRMAYERLASNASKYLKDETLKDKFFEIFWNGWLIPSTPVMCNFGTDRGLPISCFSGVVGDDMGEIFRKNMEMALLSKHGGGTAYDFSKVRPIGSLIKGGKNGSSDGIIPFMKTFDSTIIASKQGSTRRGATALYLDIDHKEYKDFLNIREPKGDVNRQCHNVHQGAIISDNFMNEVVEKNGRAREVWLETIKKRVKTGEPYLLFKDNANKVTPDFWKKNNLEIKHSNLCVVPETKILTKGGYLAIGDHEGEYHDIWNGKEWSNVKILKTGKDQKILNVNFSNGQSIECTEYHKFYIQEGYSHGTGKNKLKIYEKRANELNEGDKVIKCRLPVIEFKDEFKDAYTQGFFTGDGCRSKGKNHIDLYGAKMSLKSKLNFTNENYSNGLQERIRLKVDDDYEKYQVPVKYSIKSRLDWFSGLCDSDGCLLNNNDTQSIQIASIHKDFLLEVQLMLQTLGVNSKVILANKERYEMLPDSNRELKPYKCKEAWRILIGADSIYKLTKLGFRCNRLPVLDTKPNRNSEAFVKVISIDDNGKISDTYCVNEPKEHKVVFNGILTGNCNEIYLPTDEEHTLVCCLSSLNLFKYDEWKNTDAVFLSIMFLDAVIEEFITKAENIKGIEDSVRFAKKSRALGLGALGWHSYLQSKMIPFASIQSNSLTNIIFSHIQKESQRATKYMSQKYGEPEWCKGQGVRNLTLMAIAPNRSSSKLAGGLSQGIEPFGANVYVDDDANGIHFRKNPILKKLIKEKGINDDIWERIDEQRGSIQNLPDFTKEEKEVFKTFKEINQLEIVRQAGLRQKYIDQGQSVNLAFFQDAPAKFINKVHLEAWKVGLKGLYYYRSESNLRADSQQRDLYSECLMCEG